MKIVNQLTDEVVLRELGGRLASVRLGRNLTQAALARDAGVSKRTIERLESGEVATGLSALVRVCRVLGLMDRLDGLVPAVVPTPVERLRMASRTRKRASLRRSRRPPSRKWTWGDES